MKIKFKSHQITDREVEFTHDDKVRLFELMKEEFINHIIYSRFDNPYPTHLENQVNTFCDDYGVDVEYDKDRVEFFTALVKEMKYD